MRKYCLQEIVEILDAKSNISDEKEYSPLFKDMVVNVNELTFENQSTMSMIEEVKRYVNQMRLRPLGCLAFQEFIAFREIGNRKDYEAYYFGWRKELFSLVILTLFEKSNEYIPDIENRLWFWCDLYSWELPAHIDLSDQAHQKSESEKNDLGLFAAETGFYFAEILSMIGDQLHPFLQERIKSEIHRRVIEPFLSKKFPFETNHSNWSAVCAGSIGAAALYLIKDNNTLAKVIIRVLDALEVYLTGFDKDGITGEGIYYWCYGFGFFVYFADLLKIKTRGEVDLFLDEKVRKVARFPQIMELSKGKVISYSDVASEDATLSNGLLYYLEAEYFKGIPSYNKNLNPSLYWDDTYRFAVMLRDLVWSRSKQTNSRQELPSSKVDFYEEAQWGIYKQYCEDELFCIAMKGGHNDEPHNHNDVGNFILHYGGTNFIVDLGAPEYTKDYFDPIKRYDTLQARSMAHNVAMVDRSEQKAGALHKAIVNHVSENDENFEVSYDLTRVYDSKDLVNYTRDFSIEIGTCTVSLKDRFLFSTSGHLVSECFLSYIRPVISEPGRILLESEAGRLQISYPIGLKERFDVIEYNDHSGLTRQVYRIILDFECGEKETSIDIDLIIIG